MKLILIALAVLAFPVISWWAEERDPDERAVIRMADRDRKEQAKRRPQRVCRYAQVYKIKPRQGRAAG